MKVAAPEVHRSAPPGQYGKYALNDSAVSTVDAGSQKKQLTCVVPSVEPGSKRSDGRTNDGPRELATFRLSVKDVFLGLGVTWVHTII
ncbi:hypothetical protein NPX13_g1444 [Xylaria arbuscula]|uniref:Uncharacterized protein n=1 Tax=Xylaria arbuscula TaxID=114810 RepID=A0A9W8NL19_9PEZI|nr:hypothetical protein NPX13_g1444 [Xylaria arbuscula]